MSCYWSLSLREFAVRVDNLDGSFGIKFGSERAIMFTALSLNFI